MELEQTTRTRVAPTPEPGSGRETAPREAKTRTKRAAPGHPLQQLVEGVLPKAAGAHLDALFGGTMPKSPEGRYRIVLSGRFEGKRTRDLFTYLQVGRRDGALVVADRDDERVLYVRGGRIVGSDSTVLFERLGRLLYQVESVAHADSETLVDAEEQLGAQALLLWLPSSYLRWAIERRVWELGASIHLIKRGHFVFVEGEPTLVCPTVALDPEAVAIEGQRRNEALRQETSSDGGPYSAPGMDAAPPALGRALAPIDIDAAALDHVLERIREAESGQRS